MENNWLNLLNKYGQIINEVHLANIYNRNPNMAAYHHAVGVLEGYALACYEAGIATDEEYKYMLQQVKAIENGEVL